MTEFRSVCYGFLAKGSALKCFSQEHNGVMRIDFKPRPYRSRLLSIRRSHPPVTLPTFYNKYAFKDTVFHLYEVNVLFSPNFKLVLVN